MKVGIHTERFRDFSDYLNKYEQILDYNGIKHVRLNSNEGSLFWKQLYGLDLFIWRWIHNNYDRQKALSIIPVIENSIGIKCFPDINTCWAFDDKIREYYLLKENGFPIIDCHIFWDYEKARNWIETAKLPVVFKLKGGAGSSNVVLVKDRKTGLRLIKKMFSTGIRSGEVPKWARAVKYTSFYQDIRKIGGKMFSYLGRPNCYDVKHKDYVLFQDYLSNNNYDTRINIIGDRAFAFRRFNRENDFRASGSGKIDFTPEEIDKSMLQIAFEISKKLKFKSMAYDFIYDEERKPKIIEMSYTCPDQNIHKCSGYWDSGLNWHDGHYWPQYCYLVDALNLPDLEQPDLS